MTIDHKTLYDTEHISSDYAARDYLFPAEKAIICKLKDKLSAMDMLDMGVGGGRTTKYFAPLVRSYLGADYAPSMINACKEKYGKTCSFQEIDVRNMKEINDNSYDFILFSYNGIDSFAHKDRIEALQEIRRVLRQGGFFYFSSHNLNWNGLKNIFRIKNSLRNHSNNQPGTHLYKTPQSYSYNTFYNNLNNLPGNKIHISAGDSLGDSSNPSKFNLKLNLKKTWNVLRLSYLNRSLNMDTHIEKLRKKKRVFLYDNSLNGKAGVYYVTIDEQIRQLKESGFNYISIYSHEGIKTEDKNILNYGGWIYYLCS